ncbi:transporter substrate-binding domain-containing protein [Clostridium sp. YIM B02555]|uniref:transporter substrate-binding domain-containing protein n=1 Tax=Clostridium sp. YIM B02555 TaxID=2911968 RepID=UPI001EEE6C0A|nr:transporter substrate-binding domain-containing protein [Clostridium sp. YIM B02555]
MKKIRKIIAVTLCVATILALSGCGSKKTGDDKVLRVGTEGASAPFNWTQTDNSNNAVQINGTNEYANGYDLMIAQKIADKIGYKLEVHKMDFDGLIPGVSTGKIDVAIAQMSITKERMQSVDFSDPYYKANIVALTKKGTAYENAKSVADLKGAICTSQLSTVWYDMLKQIPDAKIQPAMDTVPSLIVALSSGKVNVVTMDKPTAMAAVYSNPDLVMITPEGDKGFNASDEDVNIGIAIKKGNKELTDKINKAISEISEDDRNKMMEQAIKNQPLSK